MPHMAALETEKREEPWALPSFYNDPNRLLVNDWEVTRVNQQEFLSTTHMNTGAILDI
jgi:hypothetical protein